MEGKVTGITKFGAFVDLGGKTGMVHISEITTSYVKEIRDYLTENQTVKVKVLAIAPDGKISLSIKQAAAPPPRSSAPRSSSYASRPGGYGNAGGSGRGEMSFEDMMNKFKSSSDEKQGDIKRRSNSGAAPRPRGGKKGKGSDWE